ncbi:MAG: hypothetical protein ACD_38C00058G0003 [uncultured bacterium]|nr:MAG: hypothetical protein ACD_38C00058G0003 [uncultured bacterium]
MLTAAAWLVAVTKHRSTRRSETLTLSLVSLYEYFVN